MLEGITTGLPDNQTVPGGTSGLTIGLPNPGVIGIQIKEEEDEEETMVSKEEEVEEAICLIIPGK